MLLLRFSKSVYVSRAGFSVLDSDSLCFSNVGLKGMFLVMLCRGHAV